jgi:hypothetical protein
MRPAKDALQAHGRQISAPCGLDAVRPDQAWSMDYQIDWSKVVISMIKVDGGA